MTTEKTVRGRPPFTWVPTLYFAEGLPNYTVGVIAVLMYQSLGAPNDQIAHWTGLLGFAWALKAFWSPLVEAAKSKKSVVVWFQLLAGISLVAVGSTLQLPHYFALSVALLGIVAIASATHDIAADGLYIASLSNKQQARYAGWQGGFYNTAKFVTLGGLPILQGYLDQRMGAAAAWAIIFSIIGGALILVGLYHIWSLPNPPTSTVADPLVAKGFDTFRDVFVEFLKKPGVWMAIVFILLFRAGEAQVTTIGPLFLRDSRAAGGLGLTMSQFGQYYGIGGTLTFIGGTILGGYFAAWVGLRRAMFFLIVAMNLPNLAFLYLSTALPTDQYLIAGAIAVEMFGFGFGFVGIMLFIMQVVSVGKYQTAHYAIGTGLMALGLSLFRMISGDIQIALGYKNFFVWALAAAIPVLILSFRIVPKKVAEHEPPTQLEVDHALQPD